MTSVELPVAKPMVSAYQFYAFPLAVIERSVGAEAWIYSNFIQVAYDPAGQDCHVPFCFYLNDYTRSPWLESRDIGRDWFAGEQIEENTRRALAEGWYVYLMWDEQYVARRRYHGEEFYPHDALVHGFDTERDTYSVFGYDERYQLVSVEVPASEFRAANKSLDLDHQRETPLMLYRPRVARDYIVDIPLISRTLEEYLTGFNTSTHFAMERTPMQRHYGIDSYEPLASYVSRYIDGDEEYDIRHLHVLWEHKLLMAKRMSYLSASYPDLRELLRGFEKIHRDALKLRNAMMRMEHLNHTNRVDFTSTLREMRTTEVLLIEQSVEILKDENQSVGIA